MMDRIAYNMQLHACVDFLCLGTVLPFELVRCRTRAVLFEYGRPVTTVVYMIVRTEGFFFFLMGFMLYGILISCLCACVYVFFFQM